MSFETIEVTRGDDGVAVVTLNRPDQLNAMNIKMSAEMPQAMWALEEDDSVRVIVLTGAGRAFSSGFDVSEGAAAFGEEGHEAHDEGTGMNDSEITDAFAWWRMRTPVIAAINGVAIGAGLTTTLLADIRIVAEDAKLRFSFVRLNLAPDASSTWMLPRIVGVSNAMDLLLTGRTFLGSEAVALGLASKAVPADQVLDTALELARDIAANCAPIATGVTKQLIYDGLATGDRTAAMTEETRVIWWIGAQPDTVAGMMGMATRQPPEWTQSKRTPVPEA
jgi:enoyl-CoA hydratase/carnithine racemase